MRTRAIMKQEKNEYNDLVLLKSLLEDKAFKDINAELPVVVGRDLAARARVIDLSFAPNVLIAGATGQGKTTELHSMIVSLLRSRTPDEVKFVFIDPKDYELSAYGSLCREYVAGLSGMEDRTVLVSAGEIEKALDSLCHEMRRRLAAFRPEGTSTIWDYNAKAASGARMPYLVVAVDEYSDISAAFGRRLGGAPMAVRTRITSHLYELAHDGQPSGIHLVVTTQNPSSEVIDPFIRSTFRTRMAFRTLSDMDSRIIVDTAGAEHLAGNGDMLFSMGGKVEHLRGAYVGREDVEAAVREAAGRCSL